MSNILFIGLGNMGFPMAGHLASHGHNVTVYNRTESRAGLWLNEYPGQKITAFTELPDNIAAVFLCVGRDDDVRALLTGSQDPLLDRLPPGTLVIDHTTTSARLAEEMAAACRQRGLLFADAPVSGGQQGAISGQLSLMVGADAEVFRQVKQLTTPYTRAIEHMGPAGHGQKTKMVNQICVAGLIEALAEGMYFAQQAGLDVNQVMSVISQGAAGSWQMTNRYRTMLDGHYEHGFAVNWMHKDLLICLQEAATLGIELPVTAQVDQYYQQLQQMGAGEFDTSSLLYRLQQKA